MTAEVFTGLYDTQKRAFLKTITRSPTELGQDIIYAVCNHLQLEVSTVLSANRKRNLAMCRQICMHFMKVKTVLSLKQIGVLLGNRDHSTILYGIETFNDIFETDKDFREVVRGLDKLLNV